MTGQGKGSGGMVAGDEPQAVMVGRDALAAGGNAADAAVAMAFALSVTLPSQAGLGASGVCMVYDHDQGKTEVLDFIAPPGSQLPALPRAMYSLHSKYGQLRWERVLTPAETMARFGAPVSRALAQQLVPASATLLADSEARRIFARPDGTLLSEGLPLVQSELGATLARLRARGIGEFYSGPWAAEIVASVRAAGGSLTAEEMRGYVPQWKDAVGIHYGADMAYFPPPPATGGVVEAQLWAALARDNTYADTDNEVRPHLLTEAYSRLFADRQHWMRADGSVTETSAALISRERLSGLFADYGASGHASTKMAEAEAAPSGTGFAVMDGHGSAVACAMGLGRHFGSGRVARGTGMLLAATGQGSYGIGAPMLAVNNIDAQLRYVAAAGGGQAASTAMTQVALAALVDGQPLDRAVAATRLHAFGDVVAAEPGSPAIAGLEKRGHRVEELASPARVNAIACHDEPNASNCSTVTDPRGFGMAVVVGN